MIHHYTYAVSEKNLKHETEMWNALGFNRFHSHASSNKNWLASLHTAIHLRPTTEPVLPDRRNHTAIVPARGLDYTMKSLDDLDFPIRAEKAQPYWGGDRVFIETPQGYIIELLDYAPPSRWPSAPDDD